MAKDEYTIAKAHWNINIEGPDADKVNLKKIVADLEGDFEITHANATIYFYKPEVKKLTEDERNPSESKQYREKNNDGGVFQGDPSKK